MKKSNSFWAKCVNFKVLKIAFIIDKLKHGGAEHQLIELVRNLRISNRRLFDITVIIFHPVGELIKELEKITGTQLILLENTNRWGIIGVFFNSIKF